jgi:hypothetical protein
MQYQVPQFIDTEDKLVGPFSLRQFVYVGAAAVVCGICYFFLQVWLFVVVTIIAVGGAFALAFLKINGRPFIKVLTSAFNYYWKPQTYVWKPEHPVMPQHKPAQAPAAPVRVLPPVQQIAQGDSLHKSWENLQSGTPDKPEAKKTSDRQFLENKMVERYQILKHQAGDRTAARRVDYR